MEQTKKAKLEPIGTILEILPLKRSQNSDEVQIQRKEQKTNKTISMQKFQDGLEILGTQLPQLIPNLKKMKMMFFLLNDLGEDQFNSAIRRIILTHKEIYPGTNLVAVLREYALCDVDEMTGAEAWGEVRKEMSRVVGIYGTPDLKDPIAKKIVEIFGWRNLCLSENTEADRAHFLKMYDRFQNREHEKKMLGSFGPKGSV